MGEQTVNSNTEGVTTHILAEVAINRVKTHQSNTLAEVAISRDKTHHSIILAEAAT